MSMRSDDLPDPLGPTSPRVSPSATSSEMSCRISTRPALPMSERLTSVSESAGSGMGVLPVVAAGYGVSRGLGKAILAIGLTTGAALADPVRIVALGDSLTAGYGLPVTEGFVPQLQAWLDSEGIEAEVVNAGVSGDTTAGGLARVGWSLSDGADAMIVALGGNDFLRGLDPALSRANLGGILDVAAAEDVDVLLVGLKAGPNYGPDYKAAFDEMYDALAAEYGVLYAEDFFAGLLAEAGDPAGIPALLQDDGLHPNAAGVAAIVDALGPAVAELAARAE